jgi:hypothetical protein
MQALDAAKKVRGLDEWNPKHIAWENRVFMAELRRDIARDELLLAGIQHGIGVLGVELSRVARLLKSNIVLQKGELRKIASRKRK